MKNRMYTLFFLLILLSCSSGDEPISSVESPNVDTRLEEDAYITEPANEMVEETAPPPFRAGSEPAASVTPSVPVIKPGGMSSSDVSGTALDNDNLDRLSNEAFENLNKGTFNYEKIPPLPIDTVYVFQLEIILGTDKTKFQLTGEKTGGTHAAVLEKVSSEMQVNLVSLNDAFEITRLSDGIQGLDKDISTIWSWNVKPKLAGKHPVSLSIEMITKSDLNSELRKKQLTIFTQEVDVLVLEKNQLFVANDVGFNWTFLLIPVLLILALGAYFFFRKKQEIEKEQSWTKAPETAQFLLKIEKEIAEGNTGEAIRKMLQFFEDKNQTVHSDLLSLSSELNEYKRSFNLGLNPPAEIMNRINVAIVDLINNIQAKLT